jgi:hypothetical protein
VYDVVNERERVGVARGETVRVGSGQNLYPGKWQIESLRSSTRLGIGSDCGVPSMEYAQQAAKRPENAAFSIVTADLDKIA